ncbi:hypothetical protein Tco_0553221, partial [Tanacetum coccineum]
TTPPPINKRCCNSGRVTLRAPPEYPEYIKRLYADAHFMENIRAYNQMFSMTSLGANVDSSINNSKGPYMFRISGQIYHWIGSMCPEEGNTPRFLQLYIYDTTNEVSHRMAHFGGENQSGLKREIVEGLYDAILRGDHDSNDLGTRTVLTASFIGGPSISSKVKEDADVDKYISVELPDPVEDPDGYRIISELMMHGPCDLVNNNAPCMKNGNKYNRNFPKPYSDKTYIDKDGFIHYRRRETGIETERQNVRLDNRYVVPYNRTLCLRYYAHVNVVYCGWTMLIKYLFKYISKGTDRVVANITTPIGEIASTSNVQNIQIDEIRNFVEARYIGPHEACWRILEFLIHYRDPAVLTLTVHLENMQHIRFRGRDRLESNVDNPTKKKTT